MTYCRGMLESTKQVKKGEPHVRAHCPSKQDVRKDPSIEMKNRKS
jgi:hypothetical protein